MHLYSFDDNFDCNIILKNEKQLKYFAGKTICEHKVTAS